MNRLSFKYWLQNEMAQYGFGDDANAEIKGGTEIMQGDGVFAKINTNLIVNELTRMPPLGNVEAVQIWDDTVQWGNQPGAIKVSITPLGSQKLVTRRMITNLKGENTWVLRKVFPLKDNKDQYKEISIAEEVYKGLKLVSEQPLESPEKDYTDIERLAWKLWHTTKKQHPSYIMFPVTLRKQNENYYKLVYDMRGQGSGSPFSGKTGRTEQFHIDLIYEQDKGMIRCFAYDIDSPMRGHYWLIQTPEWDERFSPKQDDDEIVENIVTLFLQY